VIKVQRHKKTAADRKSPKPVMTIKPKEAPIASTSSAIIPGSKAPDFALKVTPDQIVTLKEFRGRPVILVFYPADFSPVCGDEMTLFNEVLNEFQPFNAQLLGISVDNVWCHLAFSKDRRLRFPLLSDFHPKGDVAHQYGVYRDEDGVSERALFLIDGNGIVYWNHISPIGVNPGVNGVLLALESLKKEADHYEAIER
jgi:peroxiredoxin (alkyl hydroperoxide reductase subunit C)